MTSKNKRSPSMRNLSRREREIMDVVYNLVGDTAVSAADIRAAMLDPGSYSAVRAQLRTLVEKGHLRHYQDGPRYLFQPTVAREEARESALRHVLGTFFGGSTREAVVALLEMDDELSDEQRQRLQGLIETAQEEGR